MDKPRENETGGYRGMWGFGFRLELMAIRIVRKYSEIYRVSYRIHFLFTGFTGFPVRVWGLGENGFRSEIGARGFV